MNISRRSVLNGFGQSTALGAALAALSPYLRAAQAAAPAASAAPAGPAPTYCLSMMYRQAEGASFNADLFRDKHLPLLRKVYANGVDRIELRIPAPVPEGQKAVAQPIIAAVNIWFRDITEFVNRTKTGAQEVNASMAGISSAQVSAQVDQVIAGLGEDRAAVPLSSLCHSSYFQDKDGATFDAAYFTQTFYPKLAELFGTAVRRIEVTTGAASTTGGKLLVKNAVHIYIRDEAAYDEAGSKIPSELKAEGAQHTNIAPVQTLTQLHAAG